MRIGRNLAIFFTFLVYEVVHVNAYKPCHVLSPSPKSVWISGDRSQQFIIAVDDILNLPRNMTISMYREVPLEDNLIAHQDFTRDELKKLEIGKETNLYVVPHHFAEDLTTNDEYQVAITVQKGFGREDVCTSRNFRVVMTGAQPNVPSEKRYIERVLEPVDSESYDCDNIPVKLRIQLPFKDDLVVRVEEVRHKGKRKKLGELQKEDIENKKVIATVAQIPDDFEGPFILEFAVDEAINDLVVYKSPAFTCRRNVKGKELLK